MASSGTHRPIASFRSSTATVPDQDSGLVLDDVTNHIPIFRGSESCRRSPAAVPDTLIYGMAPSTGQLSRQDRGVVLDAIARGMNIVSGLHEYLSDDPEIQPSLAKTGMSRSATSASQNPARTCACLMAASLSVKAIRIAVLGTDCAIGKRTTATVLARALNAQGIKTVLVGTGQTGLMQGAKYGVAMDAVPPQFCCGELEGRYCRRLERRTS